MGRNIRSILVIAGLWGCSSILHVPPVHGDCIPVAPFVAVTNNGRPMVGGSVSVTLSTGAGTTVYQDADCDVVYTGVVPATGIVQFFGDIETYIVTVASSGVTRQYYVNIPASATGSGINSLNGLMGSSLTIATGTSGTDFAVSASGSTITLNLPDASVSNRGVVTNGTQSITGIKTFTTNGIYDHGLVVNESGGATTSDRFRVETDTLVNALFVDAANNAVGINTSTPHILGGTFGVAAKTGDAAITATSDAGESTILTFGAASGTGITAVQSGANGWAVLAQAAGDSIVSEFSRSVNNPTHPVVKITRDFTTIADTNPALQIVEDNGVAAATHSFELLGDGATVKAYLSGDGNFEGTSDASNAVFGFVGDEGSGLGAVAGIPCLMDNGACVLLTSTTAVTAAKPIINTGVSSTDGAVEVHNAGTGQGVYGIADGSGANAIGVEGEGTADATTTTGGYFHTIRGISAEVTQVGTTASSSTAPTLKVWRKTVLTGGAALSGAVFTLIDDSNSTGRLMDLQRPASTSLFIVSNAGELSFAGVNADGTGKALCVKSDGNVGTCSDAVGGGGTCTCG